MPGQEISIPVPRTNKAVQDTILEKIKSGEYNLGKIITPREYRKMIITPDGEVKEEKFYVSGRKIPLFDIRKQLLKNHQQQGFVRDHSDEKYDNMSLEQVITQLKFLGEYDRNEGKNLMELKQILKGLERTRYLISWSDHSCILNHGQMLMTVNCLYDPAFYYTRDEIFMKTGTDVDIEAAIQKPQCYILGRCSDKLIDRLCYSDERFEDIEEINIQKAESCHGVQINDCMRMFHADHPEQAAESGQQDGGHYACCLCRSHAMDWSDLIKCFRAPCITLQDRLDMVSGEISHSKHNHGLSWFYNVSFYLLFQICIHLESD